ncbi:piggyBac transposable element-derived protein 2 [Trichonephila clavipes]|nr:piggyBac transposable element-derived protein 2 [Trichonephila clavipes]
MIALPPKVNKLTDEEGFDDTETHEPYVRDVACIIEILYLMKTMMIIERQIYQTKVKNEVARNQDQIHKWGIFDNHLSIDEMMIRYYGHHYFKQYIKCKPIRFGYKMWTLCGNNGYCYNFDLYCGKEVVDAASTVVLSKEPLGTRAVKKNASSS